MKKPQLLEIIHDEMYWFKPSRKAQIQMVKNRLAKVWKVIKLILLNMAIQLLIAVVLSIIFLSDKPDEIQVKYKKMTLTEQLDYYQAKAELYRLSHER